MTLSTPLSVKGAHWRRLQGESGHTDYRIRSYNVPNYTSHWSRCTDYTVACTFCKHTLGDVVLDDKWDGIIHVVGFLPQPITFNWVQFISNNNICFFICAKSENKSIMIEEKTCFTWRPRVLQLGNTSLFQTSTVHKPLSWLLNWDLTTVTSGIIYYCLQERFTIIQQIWLVI